MAKIFAAAASLQLVSGCDCDAALSFPDINCYTLAAQGYDCSGCSMCVNAYDTSSYLSDAWTQSINNIRSLFNAGSVTWDQDIAKDVYTYLQGHQFQQPDGSWYVRHSSVDCQDDPTCDSYARPAPYGPAGENIAAGSSSCMYVPDIAMTWAAESLKCQTNSCEDVQQGVGHFTAMVWKGAETFGCATTSEDVTMCRFKGHDTLDCSTPNMAVGGEDCYADNVDDWKYFTFANFCGKAPVDSTSVV